MGQRLSSQILLSVGKLVLRRSLTYFDRSLSWENAPFHYSSFTEPKLNYIQVEGVEKLKLGKNIGLRFRISRISSNWGYQYLIIRKLRLCIEEIFLFRFKIRNEGLDLLHYVHLRYLFSANSGHSQIHAHHWRSTQVQIVEQLVGFQPDRSEDVIYGGSLRESPTQRWDL